MIQLPERLTVHFGTMERVSPVTKEMYPCVYCEVEAKYKGHENLCSMSWIIDTALITSVGQTEFNAGELAFVMSEMAPVFEVMDNFIKKGGRS